MNLGMMIATAMMKIAIVERMTIVIVTTMAVIAMTTNKRRRK